MAPRGATRRNDAHADDYRELGTKGRKTGIGLPDLGPRDEHGLAPIDGLFSSPEKQTPNAGDDRTQGGMDMDLETDAPPGPLSVLKGVHKLLPRGTSPRKTNMQSPAIRNPLLGHSSSPVRGTIVDSDPSDPVPPQRAGSVARKLNYTASQTNGNGGRGKPARVNGTKSNGRKRAFESVEEDDDDEEAILRGHGNTQNAHNGADDSLQMVGGDDDTEPVPEETSHVEESIVEPAPVKAKANQGRRPGRPRKLKAPEPEPEPEPEAEAETASESELEAPPVFDDGPPAEDDEDNNDDTGGGDESLSPEPAPKPKSAPAAKGRGRPSTKNQAKEEKPAAKTTGKRGRPARNSAGKAQVQHEEPEPEQQEEADEEDESPRPAKRPNIGKPSKPDKTAKPAKPAGRGRPRATPAVSDPTSEPSPEPSKPKAKAPPAKKGRPGRPRKSNVGEDSVLETVQKGPPLPKSRGLYSVKREEGNAIHTTRSGRHSYAPLHYWRNERVLYNSDDDVWEDSVSRKAKHDRFVLPSTKGIVRVEEEPAEQKRRGRPARPKGKGRLAATEEPEEREPPEPWEQAEGRIEGETIVWDPDYEFNPPAPDEPVSFEINQLAVSSDAIETRNVRDASFRFTKLLSMPFFGAGIVDLPPGSEKKPKNSRKNHMTFFVHYGKVLVTVNETQFRISAGGYWNVPRGNYYNIQNDYEQPARLFFTQGCEVMITEPEGRSQLEEPNMDTTVGI